MARIVYATVLITLLAGFLAGCQDPYSPSSRRLEGSPRESIPFAPPGASETDLAEKVAVSRQAYQQDLEYLVGYYTRTGNNMKLEWARRELSSLKTMPKYRYILGPTPGEYKAATPIPAADDLFFNADAIERSAGPVIGIRDKNKLRLALQKYEQLIKDYPSSDKIDDAAYRAGVILEELNDFMVALDYFKSAFTWDPDTIHPARFKAAHVLDKQLHRYADALVLYQEALKIEARYDRHRQWKEFAEQRVRELQRLDEGQS